MLPHVAAVIPCHNHRQWVVDAMASIASQDYENKRIVVVDDGSTDGSLDVVLSSLIRPNLVHPGEWHGFFMNTIVHVLRNEVAAGPSAARNRGIKYAWDAADIFAFLDSDDMYAPEKLSRSVKPFLDHPDEIGVVYSDYSTLRPDGLRVREYKEPYSRKRLLQECIVNCDSLVSKTALAACGLFDATLRVVEDFDLWLRVSERFIFYHLPEDLVTIRVGEHSSTSKVAQATWAECYQKVMQKARERLST